MSGRPIARGAGRLTVLATAATLVAGSALLPGGQAIAARADALPATSTFSVAMPGPGHSSSWSGSIANPGADATDAFLTVTAIGGSAAAFGDLLTATVSLRSGGTVIPETPLAELLDRPPVNVGSVGAGSTLIFDGSVSLSRAAGDELQGLGATIVFQLTSVEKATAHPPLTLPDTGSTIALAAVVVGAAAIVGGGLLLGTRRKRRKQS